jgi:hypothetical protein
MCFAHLVALSVSLSSPPPQVPMPDGIPSHTADQVHWSVQSAEYAALVTVMDVSNKSNVSLRVDEQVMGALSKGELLQVSRARFAAQDLAPGKVLLVFLNKPSKVAPLFSSTGRYELEIDGSIRDVPTAKYLGAARAEAFTKAKKAEGRKLAVAKPVQSAAPAPVPGS